MNAVGAREPVAAVLMDALGTLVELLPPGPRLASVLRAGGLEVTLPEAEAAFAAEIAHYRAHHLRGRDEPSLRALRLDCARVLREGLPVTAREAISTEDLLPAMLASLRFSAFPEAAGALAGLRRAGLRLVVLSNWDISLHDVLAAAGLSRLLDGVLSSAEVGAAKPDRRAFRAALELAGTDHESAIYVGDSFTQDIAGAEAAGIAPVLLRRGPLSASGRDAPVTIASLTELGRLIAARG